MAQYNYIIYETATGRMNSYLSVAYETDIQLQDLTNKSYIQVNEFDTSMMKTHYIKDGEIVPRPKQLTILDKTTIIADGVDTILITDTPLNATFIATYDATDDFIETTIDGSDTFTTNISGKIRIEIIKFPYLDFGVTINAY